MRLNASIGIIFDLKDAVGGAPTATREGACAPQAMKFVALGEGLGKSCGIAKNLYRLVMIESTAANMAEHFADFLVKVERGETIRIRDQGRTVARMAPDCDFMPISTKLQLEPESALDR